MTKKRHGANEMQTTTPTETRTVEWSKSLDLKMVEKFPGDKEPLNPKG